MYDYLDESFRKEESSEYKLSIQVSLNGFSFCIRKPDNGSLLVFKHTALKISNEQLLTRRLEDWILEEELLQQKYKSQEIIVLSNHFTLLPANLDDEQIYSDTIRLLFSTQTEDYSISKIKQLNANLLFLVSQELKKMLNEKFEVFQLKHGVEKLIQKEESEEDGKQVRIFFDEKDLYIVYFNEQELMLCNAFSIKHANDVVYYALTALKQFQVPLSNTPLCIAGKSTYMNDSWQMLEKYFRSVDYFVPYVRHNTGVDQKTLSEYPCLF
ncbi:DUF3822 family protein [Maribellus sp. YY47]|uniref:DUF3822 family protein n=1 Tax=Maribellus sp. YY47 TaxID=2929486 RepID=UPI002001501D|nr:DUF3822 family protein [Maribellus sp. YY47]MCK3683305.1 DUF3822 family protein [Maribellus sp. YY47]